MEKKSIDLIRDLSDAFGPSGFEDEVVNRAKTYLEELGELQEDCLRNLYLYRKENRGNRPVIMVDAHSDEVGFMVHSIKPNGTIRFVTLGGWSKLALAASKVLIRNVWGDLVPGIIAAKPVHFMKPAERAGFVPEISDLVIDVGATSREEAVNAFGIRMGQPIVPATRFACDEKHDVLMGKAFDCRIGCAVLIEALRRLEGEALPCDVVGVLSSQEEVGERGCRVAVHHVKPQAALVLEGCPADDTFTEPYAIQTALRKGPMFRFMDVSVICSPRYLKFVLDLAEKKKLPIQTSVREGGGNNAAVINTAFDGIPAVVAGVPVRYIHSMHCMTSYSDFEATVELVIEILRNLTPDVIAGF